MAKNPRTNAWFTVFVDTLDVDRLVGSVYASVTPQQMYLFLGTKVRTYLREDIIKRFEDRGDSKSGNWPWLSDATREIRARQGFKPDLPINVRRGQMFTELIDNYHTSVGGGGATLQVPGPVNDPFVRRKIETAQVGSNNNPIANFGPTPPRPVLAVNEGDLAAILGLLQHHVMEFVIAGIR